MTAEELLQGQAATDELNQFFDQNFVIILIFAIGLIALYMTAGRIVRATLPRVLDRRGKDLDIDGVEAAEIEKRTETLSSLAITVIRLTAVSGLVLIFIGIFQLWSLLTVAALFLAAVTLAGQSIVLDYLMGLFIVFEGTFFKGDNIEFKDMKGDVEDVGLRRTIVRGPDGTVHSISNGELRIVSNRTRIFAAAEVKVRGIREEDLDDVTAIGERIGRELAADPAYEADIMEPHTLRFLEDNDDLGVEAIFRGKVAAARRWAIATEMRRRLTRALVDADIELSKRGVAARVPRRDSRGNAVEPSGPILDALDDD